MAPHLPEFRPIIMPSTPVAKTAPGTAARRAEGESLSRLRVECVVCGHRIDPENLAALATFRCHVRAFFGEAFRLWRCPTCRVIHCLDVVDLDHYYAKYPFAAARLTPVWRLFYRELLRRFEKHGLCPKHKFLDYGCGNGLFGEFLRRRGFGGYRGFDPYGSPDALGDASVLREGPFDYVLLQDVLEHVEDPRALLSELDGHLAADGHILVGTPNADRIDLARPETFKNEVHAPYHLHIYTREAVEDLGRRIGWVPVDFFDRSYHDRPWFGMNTRAAKRYQDLMDGSFDAYFEPLQIRRALRSPSFFFYAIFGYWLSYRSDMSIMFRKPHSKGDRRST